MNSTSDWVFHLDKAIANMSADRRILYFRSENRHVIEDAVNSSIALLERLGEARLIDTDAYAKMRKARQCFALTELYKPDGVIGRILLRAKNSSGEEFSLKPKLLTLSDFQVFSEANRSNMLKAFLDCPELSGALLLISSPHILIPDGFSGEIELISDTFITKKDILLMLQRKVRAEEKERGKTYFSDEALSEFSDSFVGLTSEQVKNVLSAMEGELCSGLKKASHLGYIQREKRSEAEKDTAIRFIEIEKNESVAGLGNFTKWLKDRKTDFQDPIRAEQGGTPAPKGVLLCGVPGTGKTAMARETARVLEVPLIQFDISRIQGSKLGESEARLRRYLDRISAFGNCVMLMDEIEKTFSVNDSTHEVKLAMLGILLDWMQTRKANVLTFITANNIAKLPPELLRDGRISGRFFAFMPMRDDLTAILRLKLKKLTGSGLFNQAFVRVIEEEKNADLCQIFDTIALNAKSALENGEIRIPFMTGANLENLVELTIRALRNSKKCSRPYSLDQFAENMCAQASSPAFIPQGQSNMTDLVNMWLKAQQRQYQDVSSNTVLPFSRFKDGQFFSLAQPESAYDQLFQETFREEIEKKWKSTQDEENLRKKLSQGHSA